ncbi:MAG: hypothetical protein ACYDDF_10940 [Thermoplasmatota archaeon]
MTETVDGKAASVREMLQAVEDIDRLISRRVDRALGTVQILRALAVASIFVFYQFVLWNPAPFAALFGPALTWLWIIPLVLTRAVSMVLTTRLERAAREMGRDLRLPEVWLPALVGSGVAVVFLASGHIELMSGALLVAIGAIHVGMTRSLAKGGLLRRLTLFYAATAVVAGIALFAIHPSWSYGAVGTIVVAGGIALGSLRFAGNH